jgi:xylulokinase
MVIAGVDVGSSFIKVALIDADAGQLVRTERVSFPEFEPGLPPLHREVDPLRVLSAVEGLLAALPLDHCDGLILCGQMHGFVLVDEHCRPVSNYISWLDQRVRSVEGLLTAGELREIGNEFREAIAVSQLWWMNGHGLVPHGAMPVSLADFVAARLCEVTPVLEPTQAAAFGALKLSTMQWHQGILTKLGLETLRWPEVRPSGSPIGQWRGAPCWTTIGDQQCALAGALLQPGELSINIGTGSQIALIADSYETANHQTRPYFQGRFLRTITHIPGGRALSALLGLLTEIGGTSEEQAWRYVEPAIRSVNQTDVRASIAFYPGPCGERGFVQNLNEANLGIGHLFRAVFDSMATNYESCALRLDPARSAQRIVFSGGVARRFEFLRECIADTLKLPYRLSPHPEDTLYGLLVRAQALLGIRDTAT